jgi:CheY-like chemotaxis protein
MSAEDSPPTVLIVDDHFMARETLATLLRLFGLSVATAGDGAEALD